jgi:hypothetical protein
MQYPVYRKYPNDLAFFRILSEDEFEELSIIGTRYTLSRIKAQILPDRVYIKDMLDLHNGHWVLSSEEEYFAMKKECEENRRLIAQ